MNKQALLFFIIIFLLYPNDLFATNYFVNAREGNSKFSGLTPTLAKKSIQEAAVMTRPGDTVFVMSGVYANACSGCNVLDVPASGTKNNYIVFCNYPNQHPIIKFDGWAGISIKNGISYVKIIGFEIVGNNSKITLKRALRQPQSCANNKGKLDPKYNGNAIVVESSKNKRSHHLIIAKNVVHDCGGGGIGVAHADYVTIEENIVYNTSWYTVFGTSGISLYQFWNFDNVPGYHNFIRKNKCYNNRSLVPWIKMCKIYDGNGIIIDDFRNKQNGSKLKEYKSRTLIENNVCWFNGGTGIHTFQSDHVDIINNTAYCNSRSKDFNPGQILCGLSDDNKIINNILVADSNAVINSNYGNTNLTYQNNLHYNVTYANSAKTAITTPSCLNGLNPLFASAKNSLKANFTLQGNSPALRRGTILIYSKVDFNGNKRDRTTPPNIGAY